MPGTCFAHVGRAVRRDTARRVPLLCGPPKLEERNGRSMPRACCAPSSIQRCLECAGERPGACATPLTNFALVQYRQGSLLKAHDIDGGV